ncbi:ATP-binding protein [Dyella koreensis]|uniref:histidine kinase n=1 Tax=Dyella koreensis TaxID=311235 RepID=A0ABW8K6Q6_9GAMM
MRVMGCTRAEVKESTPALVACDVLAVARCCVDAQRLAMEAKGLQVKLDLPRGPLSYLMLDETRLRQVLDNLFGNAVKCTAHGRVGMILWQEPMSDGKGGVRLIVEVYGTGFGIPVDQQRRLLKPFSQAHGLLVTQPGGFGLGLSICREIVEALGGRLSLGSKVGVGTSVRMELPTGPVSVDEDVAEGRPTMAPVSVSGQRGKVLATSAGFTEIEQDDRELFALEARKDMAAIRAAMDSGDPALAARHAHRIKGSTMMFDDRRVQALADDIDRILIAQKHVDRKCVEALLSALENML